MKKTNAIILSEKITVEKFSQLVKKFEPIYEKSGDVFQCRISTDNDYLWVFKDDSMIPVYDDIGCIDEIERKLGGLSIGTVLILESTASIGGDELVRQVICEIASLMPTVWEPEDTVFLDHEKLLSMCKK